MRAFAILSCLIASTLAFTISSPGDNTDWNNDGAQTLSWQRVDTDPANFSVVLFNPSTQKQVLIAKDVDGKLGTLKIQPPSDGGWPNGEKFRIRLVRDSQSLTAILAESQDFDIKDIPVASRTATSTSPSATSPSGGADPSKTPGAASSLTVQTGLVALMSMLGFALV
ncbi:hypothetical protein BJ165DRAFT_419703 [Panaeolus papilionaceus]|nr:hypothetical protein BJ165DRAFT_419703 [Panaeolus papilionaceus]